MNKLRQVVLALWLIGALAGVGYYVFNRSEFTPEQIAEFLGRNQPWFLAAYFTFLIMRVFVLVPATPFIFAGFRVAVPVAMIVVVITEMVSSADGLGYQVVYALSSLRTDRMLAVVIVIAALGYLLDKAVVLARDRLIYWERLDAYYV